MRIHFEKVFLILQKETKKKYEFSILNPRRNTSLNQESNSDREDTKPNLKEISEPFK